VDIEAVACVHNLQYKFSTSLSPFYSDMAVGSTESRLVFNLRGATVKLLFWVRVRVRVVLGLVLGLGLGTERKCLQ